MYRNKIYQSSVDEKDDISLSSFERDANSNLGIAVSYKKNDNNGSMYYLFLLCDPIRGVVSEHIIPLLHQGVDHIHLLYDYYTSSWVIGIDAFVKSDPTDYSHKIVDMYSLSFDKLLVLKKILRLEESQEVGNSRIVTLWLGENTFHVLVEHYWLGALDAPRMALIQSNNSAEINLVRGYMCVPYVFVSSFITLTCQYQSEICKWHLTLSAYAKEGIQIEQKDIPDVFFLSHRTDDFFSDDLGDWLWPMIYVCPGPDDKNHHETCVAALFLQKKFQHKLLELQGGLYHIDSMGEIICQERSEYGESLHFCVCGKQIIGTDVFNGERRLWSWAVLGGTKRLIRTKLSSETLRVTLLSSDATNQEILPSFWCVEEYASGIRVSLWTSDTFEMMQEMWIDEVTLPSRRPFLHRDMRSGSIITFQKSLVVLVLTKNKQLEILQFFS